MYKNLPVFLSTTFVLLVALAGWLSVETSRLQETIVDIEAEIELLEAENTYLRGRVAELREQRDSLGQRMQDWLDAWEVGMAEVSAYAPMDPGAVRDWDFSGDPAITASGAKVVPGVTAAAGPDIAFGTRVWVAGAGHRVVQDRGGRIGAGKVDLVVPTQDDAFAWGRRMARVVWQK